MQSFHRTAVALLRFQESVRDNISKSLPDGDKRSIIWNLYTPERPINYPNEVFPILMHEFGFTEDDLEDTWSIWITHDPDDYDRFMSVRDFDPTTGRISLLSFYENEHEIPLHIQPNWFFEEIHHPESSLSGLFVPLVVDTVVNRRLKYVELPYLINQSGTIKNRANEVLVPYANKEGISRITRRYGKETREQLVARLLRMSLKYLKSS